MSHENTLEAMGEHLKLLLHESETSCMPGVVETGHVDLQVDDDGYETQVNDYRYRYAHFDASLNVIVVV